MDKALRSYYKERTRSIMDSFTSSFDFGSSAGKKHFGLTLSALAIRSRVNTEGCFLPFSMLAKKLCDRLDLVDSSSWDIDCCTRVAFILLITYCSCLYSSPISNKIVPLEVDSMLYSNILCSIVVLLEKYRNLTFLLA